MPFPTISVRGSRRGSPRSPSCGGRVEGGPAHRQAAQFPSVKWVHCGGSGYEHLLPLDLNRVVLTNCVGVLAPFLAETVVAGMLALNSRLVRYHAQQAKRQWSPHSFRPIRGQTLLILGLGA